MAAARVSWPATCSQSEFAALTNLSKRAVQDLGGRGVLVKDGDRIRTLESLHRYHENLRRSAQGRQGENGIDLTTERAKLTVAQRQTEELKLAKARGEVMDLAEVASGWATFAGTIRASVLAIPGKVRASIPHITAHDGLVVDKICRDVLEMAVEELEGSTVAGSQDLKPLLEGPEGPVRKPRKPRKRK